MRWNTELKKSAFDRMVTAQLPALRQSAFGLTRETESAHDLVQDTLERAWRAYDRLRPDSNERAWLLRIMRNLWVSRHRSQSARPRLIAFDEIVERSMLPPSAAGAEDVADAVIDKMSAAIIRSAIEALPVEFREVMMKCAVEGEDYRSIARMLELPKGTVCSRVFRGRRRLKTVLSELGVVSDGVSEAA